jgi:hypothetical protein
MIFLTEQTNFLPGILASRACLKTACQFEVLYLSFLPEIEPSTLKSTISCNPTTNKSTSTLSVCDSSFVSSVCSLFGKMNYWIWN